jgi:hypothetical protein
LPSITEFSFLPIVLLSLFLPLRLRPPGATSSPYDACSEVEAFRAVREQRELVLLFLAYLLQRLI